jgi:hypothetical protein
MSGGEEDSRGPAFEEDDAIKDINGAEAEVLKLGWPVDVAAERSGATSRACATAWPRAGRGGAARTCSSRRERECRTR